MKTDIGQGLQGLMLAGSFANPGYTATSTGTTATSLTQTGATWNTTGNLGSGQWQGYVVFTLGAMATIISNTATVLTVDQWVTPAAPTVATSTPGTGVFYILPLCSPVFYMALSTSATAPAHGDTSLASEYWISGGGLIRKACTYAQTFSTSSTNNTYTLTGTFTANATDVTFPLPQTFQKIATFNTLTHATGVMLHETALSASATLSASGDQLTVTQTVTM